MNPTARVALQITILALLSVPAGAAPPPLPRGTEIQVNTDTTVSHFNPSVAAFPDGGFVVVWTAAGVRARFFNSQGRPTSGELPLKADGFATQVVADRDGSFLVVWTGSTGPSPSSSVYVRRFNRAGTPRGRAILANAPSTSDRRDAVAAIGPDGRFAVAWRANVPCCGPGGNYTNAVARIFTAKGLPVTREITLLAGSPPSAAGDDSEDAFPLSLALAPDGTLTAVVKQGPECVRNVLVRVPPNGGSPSLQALGSFSCTQVDRSRGSLTMGLDGSLIATWRESDVQAQRFDANGTPRGGPFGVSAEPAEAQADPAVALQAGGSFVIVWTEREGRDGEGKGVFGRAFASKGIPISEDFQINTTTQGDQYDPAIAAPRQGPVLVVWSQSLVGNGRSDIFARVLSAHP